MKNIDNFITEKYAGEQKGSSFKYNVKYSKKDFDKWKKLAKDKITKLKHGELTENEVYEWIIKNK